MEHVLRALPSYPIDIDAILASSRKPGTYRVERRLRYMRENTKDKTLRLASDGTIYKIMPNGEWRCLNKRKWTKAERKAHKRARRLERESVPPPDSEEWDH